jgi:hypothetical protein
VEVLRRDFETITLFLTTESLSIFALDLLPCENDRKSKGSISLNKTLLRGTRLAMYIVGQEETVGESSVSSGCWGEDSDHKYEWARRTPTFVAPIRFSPAAFSQSNPTPEKSTA